MSIFQAGQINVAALQVAGVYVQIVPPQLLINGVATNVVGLVGTATWGPVNAPTPIGNYAGFAAQFGNMTTRKYDAGTHVWNIYQQGPAAAVQVVRVTDGTDTAATASIQSAAMTATSKYTGSNGNNQQLAIGPGTAANSIRANVITPGALPEIFDNILQGVQSLTATAGTTYTSVPALSIAAPTAGGVQAQAGASLTVYGTPTAPGSSVGTGHVVGDFITFTNGVVLKVATVTGGVINTYAIVTTTGCSGGSVSGAGTAVPANPIAQVSSTGSGVGATATVTWGIGPAVGIVPGAGYLSAPAVTLVGGGSGSGGSYVAVPTYWVNIVSAVNNGQGGLRGPSQNMVLTNGSSAAAPTASLTTYSLAGGTDGANVTASGLLGVDTLPRTGMYALRGRGCSVVDLADCDTTSTFAAQITFGLYEGAYMIGVTPAGDTISNAATELSTVGIDSYAMKVMFGDWCYILDTINNITRLTSPQGFVAGLLANLAPNQSSLNKSINGVVATQKSSTGVPYQPGSDLQTLVSGRMDVIATPCPGGSYFGCQTGHNTSSNASIFGDNYTRMTNFLAVTLANGIGPFIGTLSTPGQMRRAKASIDGFFSNVQYTAKLIGDPGNQGAPPAWQTTLDASNNPQNQLAAGIEQASVQVTYQSVTEKFVISIQGGQTVTIARATTPAVS